MHLIDPNEQSATIAHHNIRSASNHSILGWSFNRYAALSRWLMGDEMADKLKLPHSHYDLFMLRIFFFFFRIAYSIIPGQYLADLNESRLNLMFEQVLKERATYIHRTGHEKETHDPTVKDWDKTVAMKQKQFRNIMISLFVVVIAISYFMLSGRLF